MGQMLLRYFGQRKDVPATFGPVHVLKWLKRGTKMLIEISKLIWTS